MTAEQGRDRALLISEYSSAREYAAQTQATSGVSKQRHSEGPEPGGDSAVRGPNHGTVEPGGVCTAAPGLKPR